MSLRIGSVTLRPQGDLKLPSLADAFRAAEGNVARTLLPWATALRTALKAAGPWDVCLTLADDPPAPAAPAKPRRKVPAKTNGTPA